MSGSNLIWGAEIDQEHFWWNTKDVQFQEEHL